MGVLDEKMKRMVGEQRLGYVATVCPDGTPNLSPKGTTMVWDDDHLMFADIRSPRTVANLRLNPSVEINVVDPILRKGYRFKGTATVLSEGELFEQALATYRRRGSTGRIRNVVLVRVERALPLVSPAYDSEATEEEVSDRWRSYWAELERERGSTSSGVDGPDQ
jgi:predicted pyridoxine 5'-phosphate oxidase superfamily flavin-nucleotide-binding protein